MTPTTHTPETCPFTLTVLGDPGAYWRVAVSVPDDNAPTVIDPETGDDVRDYGNADWPSDERIAAEASRQVGHRVRLVGTGDRGEQGEWVQKIETVPCLAGADEDAPPCAAPATTSRTIDEVEIDLCDAHAAEVDAEEATGGTTPRDGAPYLGGPGPDEETTMTLTDQIAVAVARYQYASVPFAPRGATAEQLATHATKLDELFSRPVLGIEVTDHALAARCSLGNADPQHGCHRAPPAGAGYFPPAGAGSAIEWAFRAMGVAPDGATMITSRADLDSVSAMAIIALDEILRAAGAPPRDRIDTVHAADSFDAAREPWAPAPLPTPERPWGDERGPVDSRRALAAINAAVQDAAIPLTTRVEWAAWWLLTGEEPEGYRARVEATRLRLVEQIIDIEAGRRAMARLIDAIEAGMAGTAFTAAERRAADAIAACGPGGPTAGWVRLDPGGRIALVEVDHPGAIGLGYYLAPVVVARAPSGLLAGKYTIAAWGDRLDHVALRAALRAAEDAAGHKPRAWGGTTTLTAYGPPSNPDTSPLGIEEVAEIVREHLK